MVSSLIKNCIAEWNHLIDPNRRKRKFHLVDNWITMHTHARWIALIGYVTGVLMLIVAGMLDGAVADIIASGALVVWIIPVMWVAHKWSKG
jgi:hypothetical protein